MRRLVSSLQKRGRKFYVNLAVKAGQERIEHFKLKIGQIVVVEGGHLSGKTKFLRRLYEQLTENGENAIFIDATTPVTKWLKEVKIPAPVAATKALAWRLQNLPEQFYLIVDNADHIEQGQKLETLLKLIARARSVVVATRAFSNLLPRLQARFREAKIITIGVGAETFDATYVVIAIIIVIVGLSGFVHIIFLAAAIRYLFQGIRIGGRRL